MLRFIVYSVIVIGAIASIPALRSRAAGPASAGYAHVAPYVREVVDPIKEQVAEREEHAIIGELKAVHDLGRPLPTPVQFQRWLNDRLTVGRDPWRNQYFLVIAADSSVYVGSSGRDQLRNTDDDIMLKAPW